MELLVLIHNSQVLAAAVCVAIHFHAAAHVLTYYEKPLVSDCYLGAAFKSDS